MDSLPTLSLDKNELEKLNPVDLSLWLRGKGLDDYYCGLLEGTGIESLSYVYLTLLAYGSRYITGVGTGGGAQGPGPPILSDRGAGPPLRFSH